MYKMELNFKYHNILGNEVRYCFYLKELFGRKGCSKDQVEITMT